MHEGRCFGTFGNLKMARLRIRDPNNVRRNQDLIREDEGVDNGIVQLAAAALVPC
jgi:hypothetical protein